MAYDYDFLKQGVTVTSFGCGEAGPYRTLRESIEDGAQRYREHAARQTIAGKFDHAACSLLKADHKDRQVARRVRIGL